MAKDGVDGSSPRRGREVWIDATSTATLASLARESSGS